MAKNLKTAARKQPKSKSLALKGTAPITRAESIAPAPVEATPSNMIMIALNSGRSMDEIKSLIEMRNQEIERLARIDFIKAKKRFQTLCPPIYKTKRVDFEHKDQQGRTSYTYAELADTIEKIQPAADATGFTYDWKTRYEGTDIWIKCVLSHEGGHTESDEVKGPADDSGKKNRIQASSSTISYLRRITLMGVCGLSSKGDDNDGRSSGMGRTESGAKILPWATAQEFNDTVKSITNGRMTVEDAERIRQFTSEQLATLKLTEDNAHNG